MISDETVKSKVADITHAKLGNKTVVCCIRTKCGYEVIGTATCSRKKDFDADIGKEESYKDAEKRLYELEEYRAQYGA